MGISSVAADILIIGGGSAGAIAAIRAKELNPDQKVVIFEKAHIKYSGSIPRGMDALNIVAVPGINTAEDYVRSSSLVCEGIMDEGPSYVMARRSWDLLKKLESWGVYFPTDENGNYEVLGAHPKGRYTVTMSEPNLKTMLYDRLTRLGCTVLNRTMAVELLVEDGRVCGAVGMNVRTGEIIVCLAKAVIITAGGAARFGLPDNGYLYGIFDCPANSGDAYALAYRAGATITGLEFTVSAYVVKDINAPLLYITLTRGAHLLNAVDDRMDFNYPTVLKMLDEHGKGYGPLRIRLKHLPEERIKSIEDILFGTEKPVLQRFFNGRGIDFRDSDIELYPTEYTLCGGHGITGIEVNEKAESSLPGLYAAGDASNVARGHLSGAFTFGELAAEQATELAAKDLPLISHGGEKIAEAAAGSLLAKIKAWQENGGPVSVEEFEYKVRRLINNFVLPPKNEYKLCRAVEEMDLHRRRLHQDVGIKTVHDLVKGFEVENIITCATLSAKASLERKESRWGLYHYRSDYPATDSRYNQHVVVKKGENEDDVVVFLRPVQKVLPESN
ncbi:MAG: FAD-binding protein [Desulfocucumaceae bacterium]